MKLDKAIEIKLRTGDELLATDPDDIDKAEALSIEALKWRRRCEQAVEPDTHPLLPGETK